MLPYFMPLENNKELYIFLLFHESWNMFPNKNTSWYLMPRLTRQLWRGGGGHHLVNRKTKSIQFSMHTQLNEFYSVLADNPYKQN